MAKYSTGSGTGDPGGGSCELCGSASETLVDASIAGASLSVCRDCAPHDDRGPASDQEGSDDRPGAGRRRAQQAARIADARKGDADYWVEHGTDYERDRLPYLAPGYGDQVRSARQDEGYTIEELAEELDCALDDLEAVEQNRATRSGVGGSVIRAIEETLGLNLTEEPA